MKKIILIPLALILLISCQNPKIIGETKLGNKTKIYTKYIHSPVSIYSDKLLTEDSLVSKIESVNSILMVTDRMKNIYEIYDADSLFVGYAGDKLYNNPLTPTILKESRYENPKETILRNFKNKTYNPSGYQLERETINYETGKKSWVVEKPVFIIPEPFHDLIQDYEINYFWVSDYGKSIVNQMIECYKSKVDTCRIRITR